MSEQLGFGDSPQPKRIYVNREANCLWYFWANEIVPIAAKSLTGYLKSVSKIDYTSDYGVSEKLIVGIEADRNYELISGWGTWFAHSLLLNLSALDPDSLKRAISIEPINNENNKVIFANIYDWQGKKVYHNYQWKDDRGVKVEPNWDEIFLAVAEQLDCRVVQQTTAILESTENKVAKKDSTPF